MAEISDLENRLSAALDRIAQGIDQIDVAPNAATIEPNETDQETIRDQAARIVELEAALAEEKAARSTLEEELKAAQDATATPPAATENTDLDAASKAHADEIEYMRSVASAEREAWKGLSSRLVRLRRTNRLMRMSSASLRKAAMDNLADADAVNASLEAELEALKANQDVERAETDVILKALQPLLGEPNADANNTGGAR